MVLSNREWVEAMSKVSKEEERLKAFSAGVSGGPYAGISWRGRDEPITISLEVFNPLNMPITASQVGF